MDEIMNMMVENADGHMEFPRESMLEDCFSNMEEPLYGFVSNITLVEESPCIVNEECFENGTKIHGTDITQPNRRGKTTTRFDSHKMKLHEWQGTSVNIFQKRVLIIFV